MVLLISGVILSLTETSVGPAVPATIGGRRARLVLDTGATKTAIVRYVARSEKTSLRTAGEPVEAFRYGGLVTAIGDRAVNEGYSVPALKTRLPRRTDGIVGNDLLLSGPIRIDGPRLELELNPSLPASEPLPLVFRRGLPIVEAAIKRPGKPPIPVEAMVDTGSAHALLLTPRLIADMGVTPGDFGAEVRVFVVGSEILARSLPIESLTLGPSAAAVPTAALPTGDDGYDCIIGWPVLRTMTTVIDPLGKRIWFLPKGP